MSRLVTALCWAGAALVCGVISALAAARWGWVGGLAVLGCCAAIYTAGAIGLWILDRRISHRLGSLVADLEQLRDALRDVLEDPEVLAQDAPQGADIERDWEAVKGRLAVERWREQEGGR
jgi:hypothetical protein